MFKTIVWCKFDIMIFVRKFLHKIGNSEYICIPELGYNSAKKLKFSHIFRVNSGQSYHFWAPCNSEICYCSAGYWSKCKLSYWACNWSLHLSSAGSTIVTVCWSTCRPVSSSICYPFRMLQPGSSSTWGDPNTSPMHWSASTGFAFQNGSSSRWPRWHFVLCTVQHRLTWRLSLLALLTCLTGEGCDLHRLISLMFRPSACQLSAVVPFRLLVLRSGTAYQTMSLPLRPCQPFGAIWRHT